MKLCAVQLHPKIGNLKDNFARIHSWIDHALVQNADAVCFPECALLGYLPQDAIFHPDFQAEHDDCLTQIQHLSKKIDILVGALARAPQNPHNRFYNAYYHFSGGTQQHIVFKTRLPNDDVFYDSRFFVSNPNPGPNNQLTVCGTKIGVGICEDMWHDTALFKSIVQKSKVDLFLCPSASPFEIGKARVRKHHMRQIISETDTPLLFLNQVGGYDGILFDGHSYLIDKSSKIKVQGSIFKEMGFLIPVGSTAPTQELTLKSIPKNHTPKNHRHSKCETLRQGLEFGLRHFIKGAACQSAIICVSGGMDSALALLLTKRALGAHRCRALILPSPFNTQSALLDAVSLCQHHTIPFQTISITPYLRTFEHMMHHHFKDAGPTVHQNLQARLRGIIAMMATNTHSGCLIGTSNKSELALGYATLYGDLCAGIFPIGDLTKTQVYTLAHHYVTEHQEFIPERILKRPPSAELAFNQRDDLDLMPYHELDPYIESMLNAELGQKESRSVPQDLQTRLRNSQFKRKQTAPILKVSSRDLGRGRQMIISGG